MKSVLIWTSVLAIGALAACSSTPEPVQERTSVRKAATELPPSGLGAQVLEAGECGLFLWSKTDTSRFIFFSKATTGMASFKPADEILALEQVSAGGTIFGQFNTEQGYLSTDGRTIELSFTPGEELQGGQRIADGLMTLTDAEGWRTKLPVLGIRACITE